MKSIEEIKKELEKKLGKGVVETYSKKTDEGRRRLRTGSVGVDYITGGGWAYGESNYIYGASSAGKSTLATLAIAEANKKGEHCLYIDAEGTYDRSYGRRLGVDDSLLEYAVPETMEDAFDIAFSMAEAEGLKVIIYDSIASSVPKKVMEGDADESDMGLKAKICSKLVPKLNMICKKKGICLIWINQLRVNIGQMYGNPETEPGGKCWEFIPSIKVVVRKYVTDKDKVKDEGEVVGNLVKASCQKNKTSPPFREVNYDIIYGSGISRFGEIIDMAIKFGIVEKSGSWFSYDGTKIGQGAEKVRDMMADNPELVEKIEEDIYKRIDNPYND